ncbi:UDP-N-acetylglucosamine--N-acetylmuramyl-(pentapeptide) pyrophosphoryl-undecaprenol N-acetylglucosamine transferase [Oxalobacteraceae bacterium GrIS 2.11]
MSGKRIMIMAAGTGGHIFPGLAIARTMQERGWTVSWLGTAHGMEGEIVAKNRIPMDALDFAGLRGKGLKHSVTGAFKLLASFVRSFQYLGQRKPDVVLGMGGYVTVPGGLMARLRGIPLVLINADAALLLSNQFLARFAQSVLFGFPADFGVAKDKALVTGNPVRDEITQLPKPAERFAARNGPLKLLVVGGSLGAKVLNDTLPAALALLPEGARPVVTHQSGKQHIASLQAAYATAQVEAQVLAFIDDMPGNYAEADLVICRAGAITVSELTAAGVASVLVPFMASSTTHQKDNAIWMAKQHAAIYLPQAEMTVGKLAQLLADTTRADCLQLAEAAYQIGQRSANQAIADVLEKITQKKAGKPDET